MILGREITYKVKSEERLPNVEVCIALIGLYFRCLQEKRNKNKNCNRRKQQKDL